MPPLSRLGGSERNQGEKSREYGKLSHYVLAGRGYLEESSVESMLYIITEPSQCRRAPVKVLWIINKKYRERQTIYSWKMTAKLRQCPGAEHKIYLTLLSMFNFSGKSQRVATVDQIPEVLRTLPDRAVSSAVSRKSWKLGAQKRRLT